MSLYGNYYPDNADLTFDQMNKIEGHYQMIADECEDKVKEDYDTLTAVLKDGTTLSGEDLGDLLVQNLSKDNFKQLLPVLNDVYKEDTESFNSFGIYSGKELGQFIIDKVHDLNYSDYDNFCQAISESEIDLHDYPKVFKHIYDLNDEDDLHTLAEQEYKDGNY